MAGVTATMTIATAAVKMPVAVVSTATASDDASSKA